MRQLLTRWTDPPKLRHAKLQHPAGKEAASGNQLSVAALTIGAANPPGTSALRLPKLPKPAGRACAINVPYASRRYAILRAFLQLQPSASVRALVMASD